ncbi:MAG: RcnB family protein [Thauera sp.]|jgi:Ni/Co efflux regulator RcnB
MLTDIRRKAAAGLILAALVTGPAFADKPDGAGGGKPERVEGGKADRGGPQDKADKRADKRAGAGGREQRADDGRADERDRGEARERQGEHRADRAPSAPRVAAHFTERHREVVHEYYGERFRVGDCPPGLARKHNGCMPPGQAKKWRIGQTLPRDVVWYDAPGDIVLRLGMPPEGHRYVRVAADILLIAVGTGMVVDALEDLNRF